MEVPASCLRTSERLARKRKTAEEIDPDYEPEATPEVPKTKPFQERKRLRRSKTVENLQKKPPPTLNYIERAEHSVENWQKKAFERRERPPTRIPKKMLENAAKFEEMINFNRNSYAAIDYPPSKSCDDDDLVDKRDPCDRYNDLLEEEDVDNEFDFWKLPKFVMGTGKGTLGGPPEFEYKSLWNYELPDFSDDDGDFDEFKKKFPWESEDKTKPNITPEILSIVACFTVGEKLDLKRIAEGTRNVEYNPDRFAPLIMRIREPKSTALIFRTGRIIVAGTRSEAECKKAARKYARIIQRFGYKVAVLNFDIQNISAACNLKFRVRLNHLSQNKLFGNLSYEPELFPGLVIPLEFPKVKFIIFCTGSVLMTGGKSEEDLRTALETVYPLVRMYAH